MHIIIEKECLFQVKLGVKKNYQTQKCIKIIIAFNYLQLVNSVVTSKACCLLVKSGMFIKKERAAVSLFPFNLKLPKSLIPDQR